MKRCDLKTFDSMRKSFKSLINKKERTTFLITTRTRLQLELEECLGNYEYCVGPESLFSAVSMQ